MNEKGTHKSTNYVYQTNLSRFIEKNIYWTISNMEIFTEIHFIWTQKFTLFEHRNSLSTSLNLTLNVSSKLRRFWYWYYYWYYRSLLRRFNDGLYFCHFYTMMQFSLFLLYEMRKKPVSYFPFLALLFLFFMFSKFVLAFQWCHKRFVDWSWWQRVFRNVAGIHI